MTVAPLVSSYVHTPAASHHANARAWATAQDFESTFISTMAQTMFEGLKTDGPFGGGQGEETFRSLLVDQYGKEMTRAGGIGIADKIYGEILKMQEHAQ
jgi:Rod binding domain-containing protein